MDHYLTITIRPDPEFSGPLLLNALYNKLHRALVSHGQKQIGVSFPRAPASQAGLGDQLRLHGTETALQQLMSAGWLRGMQDHIQLANIQPVPANSQHRVVRRVQTKHGPAHLQRLQRRLAQRENLTEQQARERLPQLPERRTRLPYLQLRSLSSGQQFKLFIEQGPLLAEPQPGTFSHYGLSSSATVPWF